MVKAKIIRNVPEWKYWDFINKGWDGVAANNLKYVEEFGKQFYKGKHMIIQFRQHRGKDFYLLFVKKREPYKRLPYPNPQKWERDWRRFLARKGEHPKYLVKKK